jgi:hypothetical protein
MHGVRDGSRWLMCTVCLRRKLTLLSKVSQRVYPGKRDVARHHRYRVAVAHRMVVIARRPVGLYKTSERRMADIVRLRAGAASLLLVEETERHSGDGNDGRVRMAGERAFQRQPRGHLQNGALLGVGERRRSASVKNRTDAQAAKYDNLVSVCRVRAALPNALRLHRVTRARHEFLLRVPRRQRTYDLICTPY